MAVQTDLSDAAKPVRRPNGMSKRIAAQKALYATRTLRSALLLLAQNAVEKTRRFTTPKPSSLGKNFCQMTRAAATMGDPRRCGAGLNGRMIAAS